MHREGTSEIIYMEIIKKMHGLVCSIGSHVIVLSFKLWLSLRASVSEET